MKKSAKGTKSAKTAVGGLEDSRFSHLKSDPKFSGLSNKSKKVVIEKRFASALTDAKFSSRAPVDKRGRRTKKSTGNDLLDLYELEEDEEKEEPVPAKKAKIQRRASSSDESEEEEKGDGNTTSLKLDLARGEGNLSSSDDSDDDESDWELPEDLQRDMDLAQLDHDAEQVEWASRRLAACNLDWKIIKAEDIYILVNSFKPPGGRVERISIYLSDFGRERLDEEDKYGPRLHISKPIEEIEEGDELDPETRAAVRKYQMDLLKYYYAVIECDSEETATNIYEQCDGFQFETSGLKMDMRFIPDDMDFEESRLKERITEGDVNVDKYKSKEKIRSGVAQTDGKVQWDENDEERAKDLREVFNSDDQNVSDKVWSSYFAQSDSEDDETAAKRTKALRALLDEGGKDEDLQVDWSDKEEKPEVKPDLEEKPNSEKEEGEDDSDIEKALAKRDAGYDSESDSGIREEDAEEKPAVETKKKNNYKSYLEKRKAKRKERKVAAKEAKEAERQELNQVGKEAKQKLKPEKTRKVVQPTDETAQKVVSDDRFKALFTDSAFAIEQSSKEFKGSKLIEKQAALKKDNRSQQTGASEDLLSKLKQKSSKWEQKKQQKAKK